MTRYAAVFTLLSVGVALSQEKQVAGANTAPETQDLVVTNVQYIYGFPKTKPNEKGKLTINSDGLTFTGVSSTYSIPRSSLIAVDAGNERVELWGTKGRLLRMAIPYGGGSVASGVMHHRVSMLTAEFRDDHKGFHSAVFYVPAEDAARVLKSLSQAPLPEDGSIARVEKAGSECQRSNVIPNSVLIEAPVRNNIQVPTAYKALVYEHIVNRIQHLKGVEHVYRAGEISESSGCPQYTIRLELTNFKQGSQVKRAIMGWAGYVVGTTQMTFRTTITDASGHQPVTQDVKATVRGASESKNVGDGLAKRIAKSYATVLKSHQS
ncbi:MAG TPA: hypothetical protein VE621_09795 [Bryobacteraceae bacterium]|nr:hypothetical protein [Bryobacteraceae bacterium]